MEPWKTVEPCSMPHWEGRPASIEGEQRTQVNSGTVWAATSHQTRHSLGRCLTNRPEQVSSALNVPQTSGK